MRSGPVGQGYATGCGQMTAVLQKGKNMIRKISAIGLASALLAATALTTTTASAQSGQLSPGPASVQMIQSQPSLTLAATGEVRVAPDMAIVTFAVVTEAVTAREAMALNANSMTTVFSALRRASIDERHIQTSGLNLQAQFDYVENQSPRLRGYQVSNRVTVRVMDLTRVGSTVDAVVAAGVNQIEGVSFGLKDPLAAENEARQLAVRALQAKARLYAESLDVSLGGIRSLSESVGYTPQPPMPMYALRSRAMAEATPVAGGELSVRIDVTGIYDIAQ